MILDLDFYFIFYFDILTWANNCTKFHQNWESGDILSDWFDMEWWPLSLNKTITLINTVWQPLWYVRLTQAGSDMEGTRGAVHSRWPSSNVTQCPGCRIYTSTAFVPQRTSFQCGATWQHWVIDVWRLTDLVRWQSGNSRVHKLN